MMYNPYQWEAMMGHGGYPGMQGGPFNPYMMMGSQQQQSMMAGGSPGLGQMNPAADLGVKPFDSSKMKQGRMGHYGYSEGRGPPVGQLPAGFQASQSPMAQSQGGSVAAGGTPSSAYYQGRSSMGWGDPGSGPRARYDGATSSGRQVQADLDTPYPRSAANEATTGWTRWGPDGLVVNRIDGRMGMNHHRLREGRV
ncbi:hypothetical protein IAR55_004567 [Kwoniella newhampshirensis]|uniref:Uncharacterized protein n=1 Tax=Kwoniella newhampshirensis TaxID=1651941 RepID=A0AAW0YNS9_9TREE